MLARRPSGDLVIGPGVASLRADSAPVPPSLEDLLRPLLLDLVERHGESAALTIDTQGGAHYLAQVPGPSAVQVPDSTGSSLPFHVVAPGLVLMAAWSSNRLTTHLGKDLERATPRSIIEPSRVNGRIHQIRKQGFVWTDQEFDLEVNGLAVPVANDRGDTIAAVSLYGPAYRLNPKDRPDLAAALRQQVGEIEIAYGPSKPGVHR